MYRVSFKALSAIIRASSPIRLTAIRPGLRINDNFYDRGRALSWIKYHVVRGFDVDAR